MLVGMMRHVDLEDAYDLPQASFDWVPVTSHRSGKFMFKAVEKLPRYTPQGVYQIQVKAEDEHGKEIVCARAKLPVMPEV